MDLTAACVAFVNVSERGSFTLGAAAAGIPQSVASRRIAALEERFGERLFDRSARAATLTPFGRSMLPAAKRLVRAAAGLDADAERARSRTLRLAMPTALDVTDLAQLVAEGRRGGIPVEVVTGEPGDRLDRVRSAEADAAVVPVPPAEASWSARLGVAGRGGEAGQLFYFDTIRRRRGQSASPSRVWVQEEDDVPSVRDRLVRVRDSRGLAPAQVSVAASLTAALAEVVSSGDLLLCPRSQAARVGLVWRPLGDIHLVRAYDLVAVDPRDAERMRAGLAGALTGCLSDEEGGR